MSDIVERLRGYDPFPSALELEAANEIERLRIRAEKAARNWFNDEHCMDEVADRIHLAEHNLALAVKALAEIRLKAADPGKRYDVSAQRACDEIKRLAVDTLEEIGKPSAPFWSKKP
jgi:hypothetical protein